MSLSISLTLWSVSLSPDLSLWLYYIFSACLIVTLLLSYISVSFSTSLTIPLIYFPRFSKSMLSFLSSLPIYPSFSSSLSFSLSLSSHFFVFSVSFLISWTLNIFPELYEIEHEICSFLQQCCCCISGPILLSLLEGRTVCYFIGLDRISDIYQYPVSVWYPAVHYLLLFQFSLRYLECSISSILPDILSFNVCY